MCLGVPGRVVEIDGPIATVDFMGARRTVSLHLLDEPVSPGDYVLNHVGIALRRIPPEEVGDMLALFDRLLEWDERDGPDLGKAP